MLDSIYKNNFYELRYEGYNFELCDEVYAIRDISGIPSDRIRPDIENPRKSGTGNMVFGFILLGWGAGISFTIGNKRQKEHDRWEKKYE